MINGKVLVVEDDTYWNQGWRHQLAGKVAAFIGVPSVGAAVKQLAAHPDIVAVASAIAPENSLCLVERLKAVNFSGPMIAVSGDSENRRALIQAGFTHGAEKWTMPKVLLGALGA